MTPCRSSKMTQASTKKSKIRIFSKSKKLFLTFFWFSVWTYVLHLLACLSHFLGVLWVFWANLVVQSAIKIDAKNSKSKKSKSKNYVWHFLDFCSELCFALFSMFWSFFGGFYGFFGPIWSSKVTSKSTKQIQNHKKIKVKKIFFDIFWISAQSCVLHFSAFLGHFLGVLSHPGRPKWHQKPMKNITIRIVFRYFKCLTFKMAKWRAPEARAPRRRRAPPSEAQAAAPPEA